MVAKRKIRNSDFNISQYFDHRRQIFNEPTLPMTPSINMNNSTQQTD